MIDSGKLCSICGNPMGCFGGSICQKCMLEIDSTVEIGKPSCAEELPNFGETN